MKKLTEYEKKLIKLVLVSDKRFNKIADSVCNVFGTSNEIDLLNTDELLIGLEIGKSDRAYDILFAYSGGDIDVDTAVDLIEKLREEVSANG